MTLITSLERCGHLVDSMTPGRFSPTEVKREIKTLAAVIHAEAPSSARGLSLADRVKVGLIEERISRKFEELVRTPHSFRTTVFNPSRTKAAIATIIDHISKFEKVSYSEELLGLVCDIDQLREILGIGPEASYEANAAMQGAFIRKITEGMDEEHKTAVATAWAISFIKNPIHIDKEIVYLS